MALEVKNPPAKAGDIRDVGLIPESGRSPGEGNGNSLQYSCLENLAMARGAWQTAVHGVLESWTQWKRLSTRHLCQSRRVFGLGLVAEWWWGLGGTQGLQQCSGCRSSVYSQAVGPRLLCLHGVSCSDLGTCLVVQWLRI